MPEPDKSTEDLLAKLRASAPPIPPAPSTSDFLVKEPEGKPLTVGMENKIEEARNFNSKLNIPQPPVVEGKTEPSPPTKLQRIAVVLKNKGMDSQQQAQALNEIAEILG